MNATLFTYTMPTVTLSLGGQETIQTGVPGLEVEIDSQVDISLSATFGYNTQGFMDGNPSDGFFIQNAVATVGLTVGAGPAVGLPVGYTVSLDTTFTGTVNFNMVGPDGSNIVYGSDLDSGNYTIDTSGSLVGSLSLDISFDDGLGDSFTYYSVNFGTVTIFTWT